MSLLARIDAAIAVVDQTIAQIQAQADARIGELQIKKRALFQARAQVTPDLETAVASLENVGIRVIS